LIGDGGSVFPVPLLIYGVGVACPRNAIGASSISMAISALTNLIAHAGAGQKGSTCA